MKKTFGRFCSFKICLFYYLKHFYQEFIPSNHSKKTRAHLTHPSSLHAILPTAALPFFSQDKQPILKITPALLPRNTLKNACFSPPIKVDIYVDTFPAFSKQSSITCRPCAQASQAGGGVFLISGAQVTTVKQWLSHMK